ncbi:PRP3-domain-containing protein [Tothia fuscella]|uniref:PRP3-domain-containing protein n=1 Tax=Tothia fuscella TaxID=1048955 RepID=A0A9P4TT96_9PEZI|nr:PRP3-domain-containing protein [Tothia fuscella]
MASTNPGKRPAPVSIADQIDEARKRAAEVRARIAGNTGKASTPVNGQAAPPPPPAPNGAATNGVPAAGVSAIQARLAEIKARVAASALAAAKPAQSHNPTPPPPSRQSLPSREPPIHNDFSRQESSAGGRGGLNVGIHPALQGDYQASKDAQKGNQRNNKKEEERKTPENVNPYLADSAPSRSRRGALNFNHNMHERPAMVAANEMRRKANLEAMKKRIQEQTSKVGLDDTAETTAFEVPMPPDVEFWDEGLLSGGMVNNELITNLVVHPILIEPPQEKLISTKPMELKLTEKERKKMRRIKRLEIHKEEQAKIRLGLVPTPAPKIKHSNVMRVYGEMAVQDPTAVEAMVNKQVADRLNNHLATNAARQLTKEQKEEKRKLKAAENAKAGLNLMVFKVALTKDQLLGKHRFHIDVNAKHWSDLTGFCVISPPFSLIVVEAGEKSSREYKKAMKRVKWKGILEGGGEVLDPERWKGWEDDTCTLIHQGMIRDHRFKKWGGLRETESESQAREALARAKLENFWVQAKALEGIVED